MKKAFLTAMVVLAIGIAGPSYACEELAGPDIEVQLTGDWFQMSWTPVPGATGYRFYYAAYPDRDKWYCADLGNKTYFETRVAGACYYFLRAYNNCTESKNTAPNYFIVNKDVHYSLTHGDDQALLEIRAYGMWCQDCGDVSPVPEGTILYLHSHLKNRMDACDNVLATGVVQNGWVKFIFDNPAQLIDPGNDACNCYILDRHWITDQYCTGPNDECHLWIPQESGRNNLYLLNCDGNPELGVVYYQNKITPVPPGTPCTVVGTECLEQ